MNDTSIQLLIIGTKLFAALPLTLAVLLLPDLRGWKQFFLCGSSFKTTRILPALSQTPLVVLPWILFSSILLVPKFLYVPTLGDISDWLVMVILGVAVWLLLVGFRRSVKINALPLVVVISRVHKGTFEVHVRLERSLNRFLSCKDPSVTMQDFNNAFTNALTPQNINSLCTAGGNEIVLASLWLSRPNRIQALNVFLQGVAPANSIVVPVQVKMGRVESVILRVVQLLVQLLGKNRSIFKCSKLKMWISFARLAQGPWYSRPVMNGLSIQLN